MDVLNTKMFWDPARVCCFTGHRSKYLPFDGDRSKQGMKCLVSSLQLYIQEAIEDGYEVFLSGMADGIDLICAEIVHDFIMHENHNVRLIGVLPYADHIKKEMKNFSNRYICTLIINDCADIICLKQDKDRNCYKERNQFMVDHSNRLIGAFDKTLRGTGTRQTINMAKKAGLEQRIISIDENPVFKISGDDYFS
ncbi:MAG: SLOG family protein [Oscillospiraceae bacterium]